MKHRLTNINADTYTADCAVCGPDIRIRKSYKQKSTQKQHYRCYRKYLATKTHIERPWTLHKKDYCETCSFVPVDDCQLTVDHIDGDRNNNEFANWKTLCHNCHALKTMQSNDYMNRY